MRSEKRIVKLKLDIIFKRVFGTSKNEKIIASFIASLLEIPKESIKEIYIENVELPPEEADQKFSRLDLRMRVDDRIINIELQIKYQDDFRERTVYYGARLFGEDLKAGEEYGEINQTICINIINFDLFAHNDYYSCFKIMETKRHELLTDKFAIHFFELKKINKYKKNRPAEDWLRLIDAETEGDLMELQKSTSIPEINDAIVILRELSADEKVKAEAYYREKRLHDEATALGHARREGLSEGEAIGIKKGIKQGRREGKKEGLIEGKKEGLIEGKKEGLIEGKKEGLIEGKKEGKKEREKEIIETMLKNGYTKEEIDRIFAKSGE